MCTMSVSSSDRCLVIGCLRSWLILSELLSAVVQRIQSVTVSCLSQTPGISRWTLTPSYASCSGDGGDHCRHAEGGGFPSDGSGAGPGRLVLRVQQSRRPRPPKDVYRGPGRAVVSATSSSGGELQQFACLSGEPPPPIPHKSHVEFTWSVWEKKIKADFLSRLGQSTGAVRWSRRGWWSTTGARFVDWTPPAQSCRSSRASSDSAARRSPRPSQPAWGTRSSTGESHTVGLLPSVGWLLYCTCCFSLRPPEVVSSSFWFKPVVSISAGSPQGFKKSIKVVNYIIKKRPLKGMNRHLLIMMNTKESNFRVTLYNTGWDSFIIIRWC